MKPGSSQHHHVSSLLVEHHIQQKLSGFCCLQLGCLNHIANVLAPCNTAARSPILLQLTSDAESCPANHTTQEVHGNQDLDLLLQVSNTEWKMYLVHFEDMLCQPQRHSRAAVSCKMKSQGLGCVPHVIDMLLGRLLMHIMLLSCVHCALPAKMPASHCRHLFLVALKAMYSSSLLAPAVSAVSAAAPPPTKTATEVFGVVESKQAALMPPSKDPVWQSG